MVLDLESIVPLVLAVTALCFIPLSLFLHDRHHRPDKALLLKMHSEVGGELRTWRGRQVIAHVVPGTDRVCFLGTGRVRANKFNAPNNNYKNIVTLFTQTKLGFFEHVRVCPQGFEHKVFEAIGVKDKQAGNPDFDKLFFIEMRNHALLRKLLPLTVQDFFVQFNRNYEQSAKSDLCFTLEFGRLFVTLCREPKSPEELKAFFQLGVQVFKAINI